jgi:putative transcriptional regulator
MRKRKSDLIARILGESREFRALGMIDDDRLQRMEHVCVEAPQPITREDIRAIREQSTYTVYTLARMFNIPARRLRRWEQGLGREPHGMELRFLRMVRDFGVKTVFPLRGA